MSGLISPVTTQAQLILDFLALANQTSGSYTIDLGGDISLGSDLEAIKLASGVSLTIDGEGHALNGGGLYRGLFVYSGDVTVDNLGIVATVAAGGAGGSGLSGGGGGAGLGGGLFVASAGTVTLGNVTFTDDRAEGGAGGTVVYLPASTEGGGGGGGGMGGNGGNALDQAEAYTGAGGGGIGASAVGAGAGSRTGVGTPLASGNGIVPTGVGGGSAYAAGTGASIEAGAGYAGGGGGAFKRAGAGAVELGGGGGLGGGNASLNAAKTKAYGGAGGFGGGGGGAFGGGTNSYAGAGGFGGGGGGAVAGHDFGGAGGFGGGGGGGGDTGGGGAGGTGGGAGSLGVAGPPTTGGGGGGLGAGGDVFVQTGGRLVVQSGNWNGGTVLAGAAGTGAAAGQAAGNGLFLQGDEIVFLQPGAGQTLTIADQISDEMGSFGTTDTNSGGLVVGPGSVRLLAANDFTAGARVDPGGTLELATAASMGSGSLVFGAPVAGAAQEMILDDASVFGNFISAFTPSDTIDLTQLAYQSGGFSGSYSGLSRGGTLTIDATPANVTLHFTGAIFTFDKFRFAPDSGTGTLLELACYAAGTRILTVSGEREIETIRVGDRLPDVIARRLRRVVWIGCTTVLPAAHARPADVLPVRVRKDAFGRGMPYRDLVVSPDHALYVSGRLVPARRLIDGRRIVREEAETITYWHVELDAHGVVIAEGLPAESYLACGGRTAVGGDAGPAVFAAARREARACATLGMRRPA